MAVTEHTISITGSADRLQVCCGCSRPYLYTLTRTTNASYCTGGPTFKGTNERKEANAREIARSRLRDLLAERTIKDATRCPHCHRVNEPQLLTGQLIATSKSASWLIVSGLVFIGLGVFGIILAIVSSRSLSEAFRIISVLSTTPLIIGTLLIKWRSARLSAESRRIHDGGDSPVVQTGRPANVKM